MFTFKMLSTGATSGLLVIATIAPTALRAQSQADTVKIQSTTTDTTIRMKSGETIQIKSTPGAQIQVSPKAGGVQMTQGVMEIQIAPSNGGKGTQGVQFQLSPQGGTGQQIILQSSGTSGQGIVFSSGPSVSKPVFSTGEPTKTDSTAKADSVKADTTASKKP